MPNYYYLPEETERQRQARITLEINAENDALNLKVGEWVKYGMVVTRFRLSMIDRKSPTLLRRATAEEIFLKEGEELRRKNSEEQAAKRREWLSLPHVEAAFAIRHALNWHPETVIERMTPDEWIALRDRFSA